MTLVDALNIVAFLILAGWLIYALRRDWKTESRRCNGDCYQGRECDCQTCIVCDRPIQDNDDAGVCIQCGGRNLRR